VCIENNIEEFFWGARFHHMVTKRFFNSVNLKPQNQRKKKTKNKDCSLAKQRLAPKVLKVKGMVHSTFLLFLAWILGGKHSNFATDKLL
jgi:hypothetical protein